MKKFWICLVILAHFDPLHALDDAINKPPTDHIKTAIKAPAAAPEPSLEQNLATLAGEPSAIVGGCVNAITGAFIESSLDLCVPGPEPLIVQRLYTNTSGWSINEPEIVEMKNRKHPIVTHTLKGMISTFAEKEDKHRIRPENYRNGLTNCSSSVMSGRTSPHSLEMKVNTKDNHYNLVDGSKSRKRFEIQFIYKRKVKKDENETYFTYGLAYEQKSHGIRTVFSYQKSPQGWAVQDIINLNNNSQILNSIKFDYDNFKVNQCMVAYGNGNQSGNCIYKFKNNDRRFLEHVIPIASPDTHYEYNLTTGFMTRKIRPDNRLLEIDYYDEANPYITVRDKENTHYGRVFSIRAPVGTTHELQRTHLFLYEIHHDKRSRKFNTTRVIDAHNQETRYSYDSDSHLRSIEELGANGRTHNFFWYGKDTLFDGNLMTQTLQDAAGKIFSCRHYIYDTNGNVIQNLLFGNLTGLNQTHLKVNELGLPLVSGSDGYAKHYQYSNDGYNHLLIEQDARHIIQYVYIPKTDFLQAKFVKDLTGQIRYREFYTYNINGSITRIACDDGCLITEEDPGVTERHFTYIHYREQLPIGLPQVIEEKYFNLSTRREEPLKTVVNTHDNLGRVIQQDIYDANGQFTYNLKWEYDEHGNVLKEINPFGHASIYSYDANDNLITEQHPGNCFYTRHDYDHADRLICSVDVHPTFTLTTRHQYNLLSQKIATLDPYGHETNFEYDRLGHITKITYPAIYGEDGMPFRPSESCAYDMAANPVLKIDSRGVRTDFQYNIRGQLCHIQYHDGTVEKNIYSVDGLLEKNVALNGTTTHFEYDYLSRPVKKEIRSPYGELLSSSYIHYNHFHKLYEIDPAGVRTDYQYDAAGRLVCVTKGVAKTSYQYDACQRISKIHEFFGSGDHDFIARVQDYDIMDRIVEERTEDAQGNTITRVSYTYNEKGERIQTISYHQSTSAITAIQYNAYGDIERVTDPEGNITCCKFYYDHFNAHGQCVFAKETIDPLGHSFFLESDPLGRIRYEIRKDAMGVVRQKREFYYDTAGNCIKQIDHILTPEKPDRQLVNIFEYDTNNNLTHWIEAYATPDQKQTRYVYNAYRQKETIIKSDGVELKHAYDWMGRLSFFKSSDGSFHYQYTYDENSNVVRVDDIVHATATRRHYDTNNRLAEEILANGLAINYDYDHLARTTQINLPDKSSVNYLYNSLHLAKVQRGSYTHTYQTYNLSGLLEEAQMIGCAGKVKYNLDPSQRLTGVDTPFWKEQIPQNGFDKAGHLLKKYTKDVLGDIEGNFSYDPLYQMKAESGVANHTFIYDSLYNLIKKDSFSHKINFLNQLIHDGLESNVYDANGNLIKKGDLRLSYDALDRLISVENGSSQIQYSYDDSNRRMSSNYFSNRSLQKTVRYIYQGQNEIGACDESGKIFQLRVLGLGKGAEIGAAVLLELNGKTCVPIHNISGHVCALVDPVNGRPIETYRYTAYGQEELYDAVGMPLVTSINPWRFSSKRADEETGFVNFGRRYYNPSTARWVTADPLGLSAGPNLYAYLFNNPMIQFDLYGLEKSFGDERFCHRNYVNEGRQQQQGRSSYNDSNERSARSPVTLGSFARGVCTYLGDFVYGLGHELMPCPILKDIFQFPGHLLRGGSPSTYTMSYREEHSYYGVISDSESCGSNIVLANGICVSAAEAQGRAEDGYNKFEGKYDVYVSYNATHGFMADLFECVGQMIGVCTHATQVLGECLSTARAALGDHGTTYLNAHSQGGLTAYDAGRTLNKSVSSRVNAHTIGSPVALSEGLYGSVENITASWDFVSWGTRFYNGAKSTLGVTSATINTLKTNGGVMKAHLYNGSTYQKATNTRVDYINKF